LATRFFSPLACFTLKLPLKSPVSSLIPAELLFQDVRVTATHTATGVSRFTTTGSGGTYTISLLPVGTYSVTAEATGFKAAVAEGITLDVSQQRKVDFTLALAGVQSTVEVNAASPLLNTTT
jgi:hypothetical protein